jgi:hypothetical protein
MVTLEIQAPGFVDTLNDMLRQLREFPEKKMAPEMTEWQVQDMHRTYPYTVVYHHQVSTVIWPRGQTAKQKEAALQLKAQREAERKAWHAASQGAERQTLRKQLLRERRHRRGRIRRITRKVYQNAKYRPILREALFDSLATRMTNLLGTLHWQ